MFVPLIHTHECQIGQGTFVGTPQKELAVFQQSPGQFVVIQNACPHSNGNLASGKLDGDVVVCPLHHWRFDTRTGYCVGTTDCYVERYPCKVEEEMLLADLENPLPQPPPPNYEF